ncbi:MAG TPA: hypothetical protein DCG48_07510 [Rhodospirillaceae bacterium]|nr:hypothetical protein [Rhodospirillaceae bacterium]
MPGKHVPPTIEETAFSCPHCGAYTTQYWFNVFSNRVDAGKTPHIVTEAMVENFKNDKNLDKETRDRLLPRFRKLASGEIELYDRNDTTYTRYTLENLHASKCYNCSGVALWLHDRLIHPTIRRGAEPNEDLSPEVVRDYNEARDIIDRSPRGAAALLRLAIQKLCRELDPGEDNLNQNIKNLVARGLNKRVQQSLDIVRVIGNEAVHPGVLDLKDDVATAEKLFSLVNLIAEQMISMPKHIDDLYENVVPEDKRKAIEKRDGTTPVTPATSEDGPTEA